MDIPSRAVFTAVDGILLDPVTLDSSAIRTPLRRLQSAGVPVVPVTVMTLEEIEPIARELGFRDAMIIEAGGAIARWSGSRWDVEECGPAADTLLDVIREIEELSGAGLLVYSALPAAEAALLSGRSGEILRRSTRRCFSEPFVIESGDVEKVAQAAASLGFSIRRGRTFFHLRRACDEGKAFLCLREELRCEAAIALGGTPVDAEFLSRADIAIVVPSAEGTPDAELLANVPAARIAPFPGPAGWAAAIHEVWPEIVSRSRTRNHRSASARPARTHEASRVDL
ncbi:MAG TPA: hypothetical protein VNA69_07805 [Thermoanaerobaculia bacterium]|nr:hypothetical protein [Thermoanaerobaculia bacterium]